MTRNLLILFACFELVLAGQTVPPAQHVPESLRQDADALLNAQDAARRAQAAGRLAARTEPEAIDLLASVLEREDAPAVRRAIVDRLGRRLDPRVIAILEQRAAKDPDTDIALLALERLRRLRAGELLRIFEARQETARSRDDAAAIRALALEHQRWVTMSRGAQLPGFLQVAPPPFAAVPAERRSVRVLVIGDFGVENPDQKSVAAAVRRYHAGNPFDVGVTTGDNFLDNGVLSPSDPRWKGGWRDLYDPLNIPIFATLGNHDWGFPDSPAAEMLYSHESPVWRMPATHYTFTAGPVQFFALATDAMSETQLGWLSKELDRSTARWKVVYGHTPIYSSGVHGDSPELIRRLLPVLRGRADVYLCGHDHDMQHLRPEGTLNFFVVGGSGASIRPPKPDPRALFARAFFGFAVIEADQAAFRISFLDAGLATAHSHSLTK